MVLDIALVTFLKWVVFACFLCSSLGLKSSSQSCDPRDYLALKEFSGSLTNGSIVAAWSNEANCCQWDGVVCRNNGNGSAGNRVIKLILPRKDLEGIISQSLGRLDKLKVLDLSCNHLQGELPMEFSSLKQLEVVDLSHNMLSGRVFGMLSGLLSIQSLNMSSNLFKEDLSELGGFPNLVVFNMSNNSLLNWPEKLLLEIENCCRADNENRESGREPESELESKCNCWRDVLQLSKPSRLPTRWFIDKSRVLQSSHPCWFSLYQTIVLWAYLGHYLHCSSAKISPLLSSQRISLVKKFPEM